MHLAQLDRALGYEPRGCRFESYNAYHTLFVRSFRTARPLSAGRVTKGSIKNKRGYERYKNNNPWVVWQNVNYRHAAVAQQVEHWNENPGRDGSIPSRGTSFPSCREVKQIQAARHRT